MDPHRQADTGCLQMSGFIAEMPPIFDGGPAGDCMMERDEGR